MEDKELCEKVREIAREFPENDMKRALLLDITNRFVGTKVYSIPISELKNDLEYMKKAKAPGVKRLLMKKGIIGYLEKLLEERE